MQKLIEIRRRITVVESIEAIARTMATVASAKLSHSRARAEGMRAYAEALRRAIGRQRAYAQSLGVDVRSLSPLLAQRTDPARALLIVLSSDRGMCGNYNLVLGRAALDEVARLEAAGIEVDVYAKGLKGASFLRRHGVEALVEDSWSRAGVGDDDIAEIFDCAMGAFESGSYDHVGCVYTKFYSPLRRDPTAIRLLPLGTENAVGDETVGASGASRARWFYEPDFVDVMTEMLRLFVRLQVEDVMVESWASEQGARMITMEEAGERAARMLHDLRVARNRLRREGITSDLIGSLFATQVRGSTRGGA